MIVRFLTLVLVIVAGICLLVCEAKQQLKPRIRIEALSATIAANAICFLDRHHSKAFADDIVVKRAGVIAVKKR